MIIQEQKRKTIFSFLLESAKKTHKNHFDFSKVNQISDSQVQKNKIYGLSISKDKIKQYEHQLTKFNFTPPEQPKSQFKSNEMKKASIKFNFKDRQYISKKGKKILLIRKKTHENEKRNTIYPKEEKVRELVQSKNKVYGLEFSTPSKTIKNSDENIPQNLLPFPPKCTNKNTFYNSFYKSNNNSRTEKQRRKTLNIQRKQYDKFVMRPETKEIHLADKKREGSSLKKTRFESKVINSSIFKTRSKTEEFDNLKEILCGWEEDEQEKDEQSKNIMLFANVVNPK